MISDKSLGRVLVRVAVSTTLVLAPAAVLAAPAFAAPVVLEHADEGTTPTDRTKVGDSYGDPVHRGGWGHGRGRGWHSGSAGSC